MAEYQRRRLKFSNLEDAVADARSLLTSGYRQGGNWNLAQILGHCNDWLSFPMDGYPQVPLLLKPAIWLAKIAFGNSLRKKILQSGKMKTGAPTMPKTIKKPDFAEDEQCVEQLAALVKRFQDHRGQFHSSPLFGSMTPDEHRLLQIIHLQHHLSFLSPIENS